jgi:hypothetical protein
MLFARIAKVEKGQLECFSYKNSLQQEKQPGDQQGPQIDLP